MMDNSTDTKEKELVPPAGGESNSPAKIGGRWVDIKRDFRRFLVLMWKHFTVRRRRFLATPIEFFSPCILFVLFYLIKPLLLPQQQVTNANKTVLRTNVIPLENALMPQLVLYSPSTPLTDQLMLEAARKMNLNKLDVPPVSSSVGYYGMPENSIVYLNDLVGKMSYDSAIIIFQNMDGEQWPMSLSYTIRMKDFETRELGRLSRGVLNEPFMSLQWAIDSSYLKLRYVKQIITLSELPLADVRRSLIATIIGYFLIFICMISPMLSFMFLMTRLIHERATGVQELVAHVGVTYITYANSHNCNMVVTGLFYSICGTVVCKLSNNPYIPNTSWFYIFLMLELHFHSIMTFAFLCSHITKSGDCSSTLSLFCYILLCVPPYAIMEQKMPKILHYITGVLIPHLPMYWFWKEVSYFEAEGIKLRFKELFKSYVKTSLPISSMYIAMILQITVFLALASVLNSIFPGKYGARKPLFKRKEKVAETALNEVYEERLERDPKYFENSQLTNVSIDIEKVTKIFGKNIALSNVTFPVYRGEITVLLGHNGAGKTTLMSIMTGKAEFTCIVLVHTCWAGRGRKNIEYPNCFSPHAYFTVSRGHLRLCYFGMLNLTSGKVSVNGVDISRERKNMHRVVGMCTQHNLFFPDLTVMEHVRLFAMLRGESFVASKKSSKKLLKQLGIENKSNYKAYQLSGGMKRRLQMGCALAGGSSVLILDEPTSGLDVETRRELWNLLLSFRGDRTVVLSTHFMEEADALGDRVAALHTGRLRCHATPMFLKKNVGSGYRLSLTTVGLPQKQDITHLVTSIVPEATLKESSYNSVSYNLPSQETDKFPKLFAKLEAKKSKLDIQSIGIGISSLEDVFLKLCSDVDTQFTQEMVDIGVPEREYSKMSGCVLYLRQTCVLLRRQLRFLYYKKVSHFIVLLLPILIIIFFAWKLGKEEEKNDSSMLSSTSLDINDNNNRPTALLRVGDAEITKAVFRLQKHYENVKIEFTNSVARTFLQDSPTSPSEKYLVGIDFNATNAKVMYTTKVRQAAPVALNLLSNILAAVYFPEVDGRTIKTSSQPLREVFLPLANNDAMLKTPQKDGEWWIYILIIVILGSLMNSVALLIIEREAGTRHIHVMAGCPPVVHWLTTLLYHTLLFTIFLILPASLLFLMDREMTFNTLNFICSMFFILLLGTMTFLLVCYFVSFFFSKHGSGMVLIILICIFGVIPAAVLYTTKYGTYRVKLNLPWRISLNAAYYLCPPAVTTMAALKATYVARLNALCDNNLHMCPRILGAVFKAFPGADKYRGFDPAKCCLHEEGSDCTICITEYAPGIEVIVQIVQMVIYGLLVIMAQYGIFNGLHDRITNVWYRPPPDRFQDINVKNEKRYVHEKMETAPQQLRQGPDSMLVNELHKSYFNICRKRVNAVKGISFSVKKGECFGLLGVNGAGKSTTFQIMTGEQVATRGNIYVDGQVLKFPRRSRYLRSLGYCPQFFGLDEFQSGQDNLATMLTMHGLQTNDIIIETDYWIEIAGLERHRHVLVIGYSGGCMRRLAAVVALSSGTPITLLDEPTSGVDVSARRRVWLALRKGLRESRAVIITSHSMDEMEALCDRIGIMSSGEMGALGSAPALRAAYASGHSLQIKLTPLTDKTHDNVERLKTWVTEKFKCTLKYEHATMLHYHINETMQYSAVFASLEQMKVEFADLVEDYSVTETTLEEVFLSFAHHAPK